MTAGAAGDAARIGPGALVVVVGPSGAGKDTLIGLARAFCAQDGQGGSSIVFPRRIVTRAASAAEDHDSMTPSAFDAAAAQGCFAFSWEAHGLKYGLSAAIDAELRSGRTVVCNVSRAVVKQLRARYANLTVVLLTAPQEILQVRLAARGREDRGDVAARIARAAPATEDLAPDVVIENVGDPHDGARRLVEVLRRPASQAQ